MKVFNFILLALAGFCLAGCRHAQPAVRASAPAPAMVIVTPDNSLAGTVISYNAPGRFVVLNFPTHQMPDMDQKLFVYRRGLRVAEIKITGPQSEDNIVADVVSGNAQAGDEVRDQ